jgi:hypothetical protein
MPQSGNATTLERQDIQYISEKLVHPNPRVHDRNKTGNKNQDPMAANNKTTKRLNNNG